MKIALIGYGKMGKVVQQIAVQQHHQIVKILTSKDNPMEAGFSGSWIDDAQVIIDFSVGRAVPFNIKNAVRARIPMVEATTGWYAQLPRLREIVEAEEATCLYSSNFSIGVQALFWLTRQAGRFFSQFKEFQPYLMESHHSQKMDAPSGTALTLLGHLSESYQQAIPVSTLRAGFFPGIHEIGFDSPVDTLTLQHTARNREGFANGALFAAEWIQGKKGFYSFEEVISGERND